MEDNLNEESTSPHVHVQSDNKYYFARIKDGVLFNDWRMMYRALCDRRPEGATRISQCTRRVAPSPLTYPSWPWLWHDLFGFDTIRSRNLQAKLRSGRWRNMHCRKYMHGFVGHVHGNAFVTSYDSGITKSTQNMNANMCNGICFGKLVL